MICRWLRKRIRYLLDKVTGNNTCASCGRESAHDVSDCPQCVIAHSIEQQKYTKNIKLCSLCMDRHHALWKAFAQQLHDAFSDVTDADAEEKYENWY